MANKEFIDYKTALNELERMSRIFSDKEIYKIAISALNEINRFNGKFYEVKYRTNFAGDERAAKKLINNGIALSVQSIPKKLIKFVMAKMLQQGKSKPDKKPLTPTEIYRFILEKKFIPQSKFVSDIVFSGKNIVLKLKQDDKTTATESL